MKKFIIAIGFVAAASAAAQAGELPNEPCKKVEIEVREGGSLAISNGFVTCGLSPHNYSHQSDVSHLIDLNPMKLSQEDPLDGVVRDFEVKQDTPITAGFDIALVPLVNNAEELKALMIRQYSSVEFVSENDDGNVLSMRSSISNQTRSFTVGETVEWAGDTDVTYRVRVSAWSKPGNDGA